MKRPAVITLSLLLLAGAFIAGRISSPVAAVAQPSVIKLESSQAAAPTTSPSPETATSAPGSGELDILRQQLAREQAERVRLEEQVAQMQRKVEAYDWVREQLASGKPYNIANLQVDDSTYQITDEVAAFLALDEKQTNALRAAGENLLVQVKAWETDHAKFTEDFEGGIRFEVEPPPAEYVDQYLTFAKEELDEDAYAVISEISKLSFERLAMPRAIEAIVKEVSYGDQLEIRINYLEDGKYVFRHSTSTQYQYAGNSSFVKRWDHLLELEK